MTMTMMLTMMMQGEANPHAEDMQHKTSMQVGSGGQCKGVVRLCLDEGLIYELGKGGRPPVLQESARVLGHHPRRPRLRRVLE